MAELRKLDLTERELVRLARRAGRGWARTGTVLRVIIRPERDADQLDKTLSRQNTAVASENNRATIQVELPAQNRFDLPRIELVYVDRVLDDSNLLLTMQKLTGCRARDAYERANIPACCQFSMQRTNERGN